MSDLVQEWQRHWPCHKLDWFTRLDWQQSAHRHRADKIKYWCVCLQTRSLSFQCTDMGRIKNEIRTTELSEKRLGIHLEQLCVTHQNHVPGFSSNKAKAHWKELLQRRKWTGVKETGAVCVLNPPACSSAAFSRYLLLVQCPLPIQVGNKWTPEVKDGRIQGSVCILRALVLRGKSFKSRTQEKVTSSSLVTVSDTGWLVGVNLWSP